MSWHNLKTAASTRSCTMRQIYRLIKLNKIQFRQTNAGVEVWMDDGADLTDQPGITPVEMKIPTVPISKITEEVIHKVKAMTKSISANEQINIVEAEVEREYGLSIKSQHFFKTKLRQLFNLPVRAALSTLYAHPQLRQALEYLIVRKEPSDKGMLRSARQLSIVAPSTGELISIESELKSLYSREGANASSCYRSIKARCLKKQIVFEDMTPCTLEDLPSQPTVIRFLRNFRRENIAVRRGRSRRHDWEVSEQAYVTRDVTQYQPGELWIGDHTELDFMVLNEDGKLDRRWITAFIDMRTDLLVGYNLNWQPCSNTIALAFRSGILGQQLRAFTGEKYERVQISNIPSEVMMDNGKDYRSKYTKRVFGKIDFADDARKSVMRITRLHYTMKYHGQSKAQMERWFRSIQTMLKYMPGYKANKYENKPDSLQTDIKQGKILTVKEFDAHVAVAVDSYNNRVHRSLNGQSPLQCYLTNQNVQRAIDMRVLDFLMLKVERKPVRRCQVHLLGEDYYSDQLQEYNGKKADIYYDPTDLGFISIYVGGEFAAVAGNKRMIGRDENGWKKILRERAQGEKKMQKELKEIRRGVSDDEARRLLLEGELLDVNPVSAEMLQQKSQAITLLTGLETEAIKVDKERKESEALVELEKKTKKRKQTYLSEPGIMGKIS